MRKRNNSIRKYFRFCAETNKSVCLCPDEEHSRVCACSLSGTKSSNLKNHIRRLHPEIYEEYLKNVDLEDNPKPMITVTTEHSKDKKSVRTRIRKKRSFIRQYFLYCPETNRSKCLCQNDEGTAICAVQLRGNKASNLKVHVRKRHPHLYENYLKSENVRSNLKDTDVDGSSVSHPKPVTLGRSAIREYFEYCPETNKSECLCLNESDSARCAFQLTGNKSSNLQTHVRKRHPTVYEEYLKTTNAENSYIKPHVHINSEYSSAAGQFAPSQPISVLINQEDVINGIIEMLTVNGRPLHWLLDSGFRRSFGLVLNAANITLNEQTVVDLIKDRSQKIRTKLQSITCGKLVSVKVDCLTKVDRLFICVHVQLIHDGEIVVFTLNTLELQVPQSVETLKNSILAELEKFGISCEYIYTITIDNGVNTFKTVTSTGGNENEDEYNDIDASDLVDCLQNYDWQEHYITSIGCAAHILQLCVDDTLNEDSYNASKNYIDVIKAARVVVEAVRSHDDMAAVIQSCGLETPVLDTSNRWYCTFTMLERLLSLRSQCDALSTDDTRFFIPSATWDAIAEIVQGLLPFQKAALRLQNENITITDAYKTFNICHMETAETGSSFSEELLDNMDRRRPSVFERELFLAAMFLDPRFNFELDGEQKEKAIKHLLFLQNKLEGLQKDNDIPDSAPFNTVQPECDVDDPTEIRYEKFLSQKHKTKLQASASAPEFEIICRTFNPPRLKIHENVLQFWELNKNVYPELYPVAVVIFAVPCTQVSTTRLLSQLKFTQSPERNSWAPDVMDDILLLNANFRLNFLS